MSEESSPQPREIAEQRGDFMLLPPMAPTFGVPAMLQQSPTDFLVTRRPTAVSTGGLAHAVDATLLGRVTGRARKARGRRRAPSRELEHLLAPPEIEDDVEELEDLTTVADLPAPPRPRTLRAATPAPPAKRAVASTMPSRAEVRRAVSAPVPSSRSEVDGTAEPEVDFEAALAELPPSTFPSVGQASPVVRRRRGLDVPTPSPDEPAAEPSEPIAEPPAADVIIPKDGSEPSAIRRRQPRGRVHQPPEELLASPVPDAPALSAVRRTEDLSVPGSPAPESIISDLDHGGPAPTEATPTDSPLERGATTPGVTSMPASTDATVVAGQSDSSGEFGAPASPPTDPVARSQDSRPTLGSDAASGMSGIQRRARDADGPSASLSSAPSTTPTTDSAPLPPTPASRSSTNVEPLSSPVRVPSIDESQAIKAIDSDRVPTGDEPNPKLPEVTTDASSPSSADAARSAARSAETTRTRPLASENPLEGSSDTVRSPSSELADDDATTTPEITLTPIASDVSAPLSPLQGAGKASATSAMDVSSRSTASAPATPSPPATLSRPILASSGRTGIQRRERDQSASPRLAELGALPEPRVQGPRRIAVPETVRQVLRESVGEPPAHVTVHEGGAAAAQTDSVNAEAFTRDGQIYFASDAPVDSERGQQLLAHELTHVMQQQGRAGSMPGEHTSEGKDLEQSARRVEDQMAGGRSASTRQVVRAAPSPSADVEPLHHRTGSSSSSAISGIVSPGSSSHPVATSSAGSNSGMSVSHGGDSGVQRKAREPSRGILDGIGDTASKAWSKSKESLLGQLEQEYSGPAASKKEPDSRAKQLERQASDLYPYLRRRLRAELVRDLERRGRL